MINKKVLVLSNNCFSSKNSNGRTLLNFFGNDNAENLAQFFLQKGDPDFNACKNYFFASDKSVLKASLKGKSAGVILENKLAQKQEPVINAVASKKVARNPFTMLVRNFFWQRKNWRKKFYEWVNDFGPECVLLQAGDAPFLYSLSLEVSKKHNIPLVIYNSEDYYFKTHNYFKNSGITSIFYPIFRGVLKNAVESALEYASISIYISEDLKNSYDNKFAKNSVAIYTATDVEPVILQDKKPIFSYLGNLGLDRHKGLIKIAKALNKINPNYKLDVYGKTTNAEVLQAFDSCDVLNFCGHVDYERVKKIIHESLLVFHTESDDEFYCKDICHGFSTKIADSLASGTCFVIYAPEMLSCTKYIKANNCGCVITNEEELEEKLSEVINSSELRETYIKNALEVVRKNHNSKKNKEKFAEIINSL